jgi:hypothetical protein
MKKISLLTAAFFLTLNLVHAQSNRKDYISISTGLSFPMGSLGKKDLNDISSGFAKMGTALSASYSRVVGKQFGFAVTGYFQRHALDVESMEQSFANAKIYQPMPWFTTSQGNPPPPAYSTYPEWKFEKDNWTMAALLVGGYGEFPASNNLQLTAKAMLGAAYASSPELNGEGRSDTGYTIIKQTSGDGFGLGYMLHAGIRHKMNDRLSLLAGVEFIGTSNIKFSDVTASVFTARGTNPGNMTISQTQATGETNQTLSALNISIGLALRL